MGSGKIIDYYQVGLPCKTIVTEECSEKEVPRWGIDDWMDGWMDVAEWMRAWMELGEEIDG